MEANFVLTVLFLMIQIKLVADVDKMMEMEKERIDIDRRDVQLQRAQICFQPTTLMR